MKVCIHLQPASDTLGGAEALAANLGQMLQERHRVEIVHHRPWLSVAQLGEFVGADLGAIRGRFVERRTNYFWTSSASPLEIVRQPYRWGRELLGDADALITLTHDLPPFNPARHGVAFVLFPFTTPLEDWPLRVRADDDAVSLKVRLSREFYRQRYRQLWSGYQTRLAISDFARRWAETRWGIGCDVLPPVVDCAADASRKEPLVVSVARFAVAGVLKLQRELAQAFMATPELHSWRLRFVGSARSEPEVRYAESVGAQGDRIDVRTNAGRDVVRESFGRARVFWHAAGLDQDESSPELFEHFGIATVEAMAHGCVPVVVGRGGQREIVEHRRSGFLCDSLDEVAARTVELSRSPELWARMSAAARQRAAGFDRGPFAHHLRRLVPFL